MRGLGSYVPSMTYQTRVNDRRKEGAPSECQWFFRFVLPSRDSGPTLCLEGRSTHEPRCGAHTEGYQSGKHRLGRAKVSQADRYARNLHCEKHPP